VGNDFHFKAFLANKDKSFQKLNETFLELSIKEFFIIKKGTKHQIKVLP